MAFVLLSIAFLALGAMAMNLQYLGEGLHTAWQKLPQKVHRNGYAGPANRRALAVPGWARGSLGLAALDYGGVVYLALTYLTFIYRWPPRPL